MVAFEKLALKFERPFWTEAGMPHIVPLPHELFTCPFFATGLTSGRPVRGGM